MPTKDEWLTYCDWGKKYGEITFRSRHSTGVFTLVRAHLFCVGPWEARDSHQLGRHHG